MKNQLFLNILVTASFQIINQSAEFSKLWTDLKRINLTHFKIGSLLFTLRQDLRIEQTKSVLFGSRNKEFKS